MYNISSTFIGLVTLLLLVQSAGVSGQEVDPTRPLFATSSNVIKSNSKAMQLQSIVDNGQGATVIISGKVLKIGDHIEGYQLKSIYKNSVVLVSDEKRLTLSVFTPVVANNNEK